LVERFDIHLHAERGCDKDAGVSLIVIFELVANLVFDVEVTNTPGIVELQLLFGLDVELGWIRLCVFRRCRRPDLPLICLHSQRLLALLLINLKVPLFGLLLRWLLWLPLQIILAFIDLFLLLFLFLLLIVIDYILTCSRLPLYDALLQAPNRHQILIIERPLHTRNVRRMAFVLVKELPADTDWVVKQFHFREVVACGEVFT
jgi:hypothetical protein